MSGEVCRNPFADEPCRNTDIAVVLYINGEYYPVCHSCWLEIAESNIEWSSSEANIKTSVRMMRIPHASDGQSRMFRAPPRRHARRGEKRR